MAGISQILLDFAAWLRALVPFVIVSEWDQGIRVRNGRVTALLTSTNGIRGSGLHVFIPLIGEILTAACTLRVKDTPIQTVVTADGVEATFSLGIRWQVRDLRMLWTKVFNGTETVIDLVSGTAGAVVPTLAWADLPSKLTSTMEAEIKRRTYGWGLTVHEVYLVNLTKAPCLRLLAAAHPLAGLVNGDDA